MPTNHFYLLISSATLASVAAAAGTAEGMVAGLDDMLEKVPLVGGPAAALLQGVAAPMASVADGVVGQFGTSIMGGQGGIPGVGGLLGGRGQSGGMAGGIPVIGDLMNGLGGKGGLGGGGIPVIGDLLGGRGDQRGRDGHEERGIYGVTHGHGGTHGEHRGNGGHAHGENGNHQNQDLNDSRGEQHGNGGHGGNWNDHEERSNHDLIRI
ncbi:hypothetical protein PRIPAC_75858 [Pristionchus pacificus]|uniref:Uncharacterized protein n=1 Tax=Pristionchus pacificus TaxID=54126 RepID=A0A2A6CSX5_PRIPA|nr:hypothetical protein PRIPAC_75858 [Pristionchus pacificus]|eukprot:PDM81167.1 hypothetical protein PRIPAC_36170 [Pristionchus pacificus]